MISDIELMSPSSSSAGVYEGESSSAVTMKESEDSISSHSLSSPGMKSNP